MLSVRQARCNPRYPVHKIVSYGYGAKRFLTLTDDLGLGGMKIKTHQLLPEDVSLRFRLILGRDTIWPKGRIAYSTLLRDRQTVSGVQFLELSQEDYVALRNCLATLEGWPESRGVISSLREGSRTWIDFTKPVRNKATGGEVRHAKEIHDEKGSV